jgi:hypothetical protein
MNFKPLHRFSSRILLSCLAALFLDASGRAADLVTNNLPPIGEVLKRIAERAARDRENDRRFDAQYEYRRVKIREVRTTRGKLKQRDVIRRLNQPGQPSPETNDASRGDANRASSEEAEADANSDRLRNRGDYGKRDFPITDEVLNRFDFTLSGRETIEGRSTLILDFQPAARELPTKTFLDRFVNRMAGRLLVDEAESVIVRAELHLTETVSFVAGIAGAVYQLDCEFQRARTEDGLWYTPQLDWRVDWRELLSRKVVTVGETKDNVRRTGTPAPSLNQAAARIELP